MTGITPVSDVLNEPKIPVRVTEAVPPVQATVASGSQNFTNSGEGADAQAGAGHDHAASAAEYARINARIADIFADLSAAAATRRRMQMLNTVSLPLCPIRSLLFHYHRPVLIWWNVRSN